MLAWLRTSNCRLSYQTWSNRILMYPLLIILFWWNNLNPSNNWCIIKLHLLIMIHSLFVSITTVYIIVISSNSNDFSFVSVLIVILEITLLITNKPLITIVFVRWIGVFIFFFYVVRVHVVALVVGFLGG